MSLVRWMAIATLAAAPVAAMAQEKSRPMDPANPAEAVPAFRYASAFSNFQPMPDEKESPDKVWRAANDEMEGLGGHAGHIKAPSTSAPAASHSDAAPPHHGMDHKSKGK